MKLSIVLAVCFDSAIDQINRTLESLEKGRGEDTELIIVDASGNDAISRVVKLFVPADSLSVRVYEQDTSVYKGGCFNKGIREAKGEFIMFMTAGDVAGEDFFISMLECAKTSGSDIISCGYVYSDQSTGNENNNARQNGAMDEENRLAAIVNPGPYFAKIYLKKIFDDNGIWFTEGNFFPGGGVVTLAMMYCNDFTFVDRTLYTREIMTLDSKKAEEYADDLIMVMDFFMQECYKREMIEEYPEEVEYRYTVKGYLEPLFTYMETVPSGKASVSYVKFLRDTFTETFPDFDTNSYYMALIDADTDELVGLHMTSPRKFVNHYRK